MAGYLKPRRGKLATATSQNIVLKRGEVFFEVPTGGVGTGAGKIKMGDGTTAYSSLPYFLEPTVIDVAASTIAFTEASSTDNTTLLNAIASGAQLKTIIGNVKKLLRNLNSSVTQLNNDLANYLPLTGGTMSGSVTLNIPDNGYASYRVKHKSRDLEMHIDSSSNVGLYENSHNGWLIVQKTDGSVEIPHPTKINGKKPALCEDDCVMMSPSQFINAYGGTLPAAYGMIMIYGYSRPNNFQGDTYYFMIDSSHQIYNGYQVNGATTITWERKLGIGDFTVSGDDIIFEWL